jgi:tRNA(adenine34) deaminase
MWWSAARIQTRREKDDEDELTGLDDRNHMKRALELAQAAATAGEVPVGAVIVASDGTVLAEAHNAPILRNDATAHAEMLALRQACARAENYRLEGATVFVTLEPCVMCAGALVHARIARLVFGARDLRFGGVRSKFRLADSDILNHRIQVEEGLMGAEATALLEEFFRSRR